MTIVNLGEIDIARKIRRTAFLKEANQKVLARVGTGRTLDMKEMERLVEVAVEQAFKSITVPDDVELTVEEARRQTRNNILGYGPLDDLLANGTYSDIMVNRFDEIYVEHEGKILVTDKSFLDEAHLRNIIDRVLRALGKSVNDLNPYVDGRLPDGSRINVVIPPVALDGPMLTIRMFPQIPLTVNDLIEKYDSFTHGFARFLKIIVRNRKNIVIAGGSGSGKTTLLNVISEYIPKEERIVTIEDSAELKLSQPHVGRMEARQANYEGKGEVSIRDLVRNALRMRPDRIVVGECRGGEAIDMLQAMNTGHDGSITTIHANSPLDVLWRLETMVTMAGFDIPLQAIRRQVSSAIDIIIQVARLADGQRKVVRVSEVLGLHDDEIQIQDLFEFRKEYVAEGGEIQGILKSVDNFPSFMDHVVPEERDILQEIFLGNDLHSEQEKVESSASGETP